MFEAISLKILRVELRTAEEAKDHHVIVVSKSIGSVDLRVLKLNHDKTVSHTCRAKEHLRHSTTGNRVFAVCRGHTAKVRKHTAKPLPCATHGKGHTATKCTAKSSLPCGLFRGARQILSGGTHEQETSLDGKNGR